MVVENKRFRFERRVAIDVSDLSYAVLEVLTNWLSLVKIIYNIAGADTTDECGGVSLQSVRHQSFDQGCGSSF